MLCTVVYRPDRPAQKGLAEWEGEVAGVEVDCQFALGVLRYAAVAAVAFFRGLCCIRSLKNFYQNFSNIFSQNSLKFSLVIFANVPYLHDYTIQQ